mmetsp:Transcript_8391/g.23174  ORF Transcript_8391/g.23174 Transcript_8391/m.23174 type:complete len:131 (-) Transcript_8391:17-409(-)
MTKLVLCAFNATQSIAERMDFLTCWDETNTGSISRGIFVQAGLTCAEKLGLPATSIAQCSSTSAGNSLLAAAALRFEALFPRATWVPNVIINGISQNNLAFDSLLGTLCSAGIEVAGCPEQEMWPTRQQV